MKAVFLQYDPEYLQVEENLRKVENLFDGVDADLIVLPELFATGYFFRSAADAASAAEPVPEGRTTERLKAWASELGATLVAGLPERAAGRLFNSAVVVAPEGWIGTYRKVHLFYEEKVHFTPGDLGFPVFEVRDRAGQPFRLGVMICFDWYFPEAARSLALQGADVIAHPSNLVRKDCPRSMPIRALENHVFTVTANRYGRESNGEQELVFVGQSLICDPAGEVLARAGREETCLGTAEIDPKAARDRQITRYNDLFGDRRPQEYALQ